MALQVTAASPERTVPVVTQASVESQDTRVSQGSVATAGIVGPQAIQASAGLLAIADSQGCPAIADTLVRPLDYRWSSAPQRPTV
jgi:hypothetical protein